MNNKNQSPPEHEDAEQRLQNGLAQILAALPELLFRLLANRKK